MAKTTINGTILKPDDTAEEGYIYFALSTTASLDGVVHARTPIRVNLDVNGDFTIQLQPTDDAGWSVSGLSYLVEERFSGKAARRFYMTVPTSVPALDYADLATYANAPSINANIDLAAEWVAWQAAANATYEAKSDPKRLGYVPQVQSLWYPEHLRRWRAALADCRYSQASITCLGDSITLGAYSNNNYPTQDDPTWRQRGWVAQLRGMFADRYGEVGEGFFLPTTAGGWSVSGGGVLNDGTSQSIGAFGRNISIISTGHTVTVVAKDCTDIVLYYWWAGSGANPTYTIDGGGSSSVSGLGGVESIGAYVLATGLSRADHTVVITGPSGLRPLAVGAFVNRASGVAVHRVAKDGTVVNDCFGLSNASWNPSDEIRQARTAYQAQGTDLAILGWSVNYLTSGWSTYGDSPATTKTRTQAIVDRLITDGAAVLLLSPSIRNPASGSFTYAQSEYNDALKEIAEATDHCAYLEVNAAWGSYSDASTLGLITDNVHPTRAGHGDIARIVYDAISGGV